MARLASYPGVFAIMEQANGMHLVGAAEFLRASLSVSSGTSTQQSVAVLQLLKPVAAKDAVSFEASWTSSASEKSASTCQGSQSSLQVPPMLVDGLLHSQHLAQFWNKVSNTSCSVRNICTQEECKAHLTQACAASNLTARCSHKHYIMHLCRHSLCSSNHHHPHCQRSTFSSFPSEHNSRPSISLTTSGRKPHRKPSLLQQFSLTTQVRTYSQHAPLQSKQVADIQQDPTLELVSESPQHSSVQHQQGLHQAASCHDTLTVQSTQAAKPPTTSHHSSLNQESHVQHPWTSTEPVPAVTDSTSTQEGSSGKQQPGKHHEPEDEDWDFIAPNALHPDAHLHAPSTLYMTGLALLSAIAAVGTAAVGMIGMFYVAYFIQEVSKQLKHNPSKETPSAAPAPASVTLASSALPTAAHASDASSASPASHVSAQPASLPSASQATAPSTALVNPGPQSPATVAVNASPPSGTTHVPAQARALVDSDAVRPPGQSEPFSTSKTTTRATAATADIITPTAADSTSSAATAEAPVPAAGTTAASASDASATSDNSAEASSTKRRWWQFWKRQ